MANYYVATTGNDSNLGTIGSPFLTINKGLSVMVAGDTLFVRTGTYNTGTIQTIPSGTSWTNAVTISAYNSEVVTFKPLTTSAPIIYHNGGRQYQIIKDLILDGSALSTGSYNNGVVCEQGSHHIRYQNCEVKDTFSNGFLIYDSSHHNEFLDCVIHGAGIRDVNYGPGHNAFYTAGDYNLVEGCEVYNCQGGIMSWASAAGTTADYNTFRYNIVHDIGTPGTNRSIGIGLANGTGGLVYNNICYGNNKGIYILVKHFNGKVYNNTVYNNYGFGIGVDNSSGNISIKNNISYSNENSQNIIYPPAAVVLANNFTSNPNFVNAVSNNFHLQAGSGAIDQGTTLPEVTDDYDGVARPQGNAYDIGAYEFVGGGTPDTTPPVGSITTPTNGATVSGTVTITCVATDNIGVANVQFYLDGQTLGGPVT